MRLTYRAPPARRLMPPKLTSSPADARRPGRDRVAHLREAVVEHVARGVAQRHLGCVGPLDRDLPSGLCDDVADQGCAMRQEVGELAQPPDRDPVAGGCVDGGAKRLYRSRVVLAGRLKPRKGGREVLIALDQIVRQSGSTGDRVARPLEDLVAGRRQRRCNGARGSCNLRPGAAGDAEQFGFGADILQRSFGATHQLIAPGGDRRHGSRRDGRELIEVTPSVSDRLHRASCGLVHRLGSVKMLPQHGDPLRREGLFDSTNRAAHRILEPRVLLEPN